jgi:2-iminobutanoate/2-iminopropanoate deaminase
MRQPITTERIAAPVGPFSAAVRDGDVVFTSGQVGQDPATGKLVSGGVAVQTAQIFENLKAVLSAAGKSLADVNKVNVYLTNFQDFAAMNQVYAAQFDKPYPARTTVGVASLPLDAAVEIEVVAR